MCIDLFMNITDSFVAFNFAVLLDESLRYIQRYTRDAIDKGEPLDQILIPLIENVRKLQMLIISFFCSCFDIWNLFAFIK